MLGEYSLYVLHNTEVPSNTKFTLLTLLSVLTLLLVGVLQHPNDVH